MSVHTCAVRSAQLSANSVVLTDRCWNHCSDKGVSLLGVVSPGRGERLNVAVVAGESVDSALSHNESELGISVASALLQMLSDVHSLLDQVVEILGDLRSETVFLQDSEDFAASHTLDLGDTVAISKGDTDLGGGSSLLSELDHLLRDVVA